MAALTLAELRARRALDFALVRKIETPLWTAHAFRSAAAASAGEPRVEDPADAAEATCYLVRIFAKTLTGPGVFAKQTDVVVNAGVEGYPYTTPLATVVSRPVPWTPHFSPLGSVCLGSLWALSRGRMQIFQLLVHVAKLLNFDEPGPIDNGYNSAAAEYARTTLHGRPLDPTLVYPTLPAEVYAPASAVLTGAPAQATRFVPISSASPASRPGGFRPLSPPRRSA